MRACESDAQIGSALNGGTPPRRIAAAAGQVLGIDLEACERAPAGSTSAHTLKRAE